MENVAIAVLAGILAELILPPPANTSMGQGDAGYDPALERILLSALLGLVIAKSVQGFPALFRSLAGRGNVSFIYPNQLPT
jgi:hypothetical protein